MAAAGGPALSASVRMVDRVHGDAAVVGALPEPAVAASLADRDVHVVRVRHGPDAGETGTMHETLLARVQAHRDVALGAAGDLGIGPGRAGESAALSELELDVVRRDPDRKVAHR